MKPYFSQTFGNADSLHAFGRDAAEAVAAARRRVASCLGAEVNEIYFTSGGTESDNWAIKGIAEKHIGRGGRIVTSSVEHSAVYESCKQLEKLGFDVVYLPVDGCGFVSCDALEAAMTADTLLVSVMYANNEIGTVQPVARLAEVAHAHGALFHTDAVQAAGALPLDVKSLGADMVSLSAHKFYGPKGCGVLYVKNGTDLQPLMSGGEQERGRRGGTTDVPAVAGAAAALEYACAVREEENLRIAALRDAFAEKVLSSVTDVIYNGPSNGAERLPNNANFTFGNVAGNLLYLLDLEGVCASNGSACSAGSSEPSRTLLAIGRSEQEAMASVRFTFGRYSAEQDAEFAALKVAECVNRLRQSGK